MASVYILFSKKLDRFYTGSSIDAVSRLEEHILKIYRSSFTAKAADWKLFLSIENLSGTQARKIEKHIKKMKSKKYIANLKKYPEMIERLKNI